MFVFIPKFTLKLKLQCTALRQKLLGGTARRHHLESSEQLSTDSEPIYCLDLGFSFSTIVRNKFRLFINFQSMIF